MENAQKRRITETVWLDAAYDILTESGVEAVKVMPLARRLGASRTGFYWHFKDREALLEAMIRRWEEKNTGNLIARAEAYAESIAEAMFNLFDCWIDDSLFDGPLDLAIRNWARNDASLQARLDEADAARLEAVTGLFERFGYGRDQAVTRAMTIMYTQIGYISMQVTEPFDTRVARMPVYIEIFTGQQAGDGDLQRFLSRHRR